MCDAVCFPTLLSFFLLGYFYPLFIVLSLRWALIVGFFSPSLITSVPRSVFLFSDLREFLVLAMLRALLHLLIEDAAKCNN